LRWSIAAVISRIAAMGNQPFDGGDAKNAHPPHAGGDKHGGGIV